jgi:hypothetical protein
MRCYSSPKLRSNAVTSEEFYVYMSCKSTCLIKHVDLKYINGTPARSSAGRSAPLGRQHYCASARGASFLLHHIMNEGNCDAAEQAGREQAGIPGGIDPSLAAADVQAASVQAASMHPTFAAFPGAHRTLPSSSLLLDPASLARAQLASIMGLGSMGSMSMGLAAAATSPMHQFGAAPAASVPPHQLSSLSLGSGHVGHGFTPFVRRSQPIVQPTIPAAPLMLHALLPQQYAGISPGLHMGAGQHQLLSLGVLGQQQLHAGMTYLLVGSGLGGAGGLGLTLGSLAGAAETYPCHSQTAFDLRGDGPKKRSVETLRKRCASQRSRRMYQADLWARLDSLVPCTGSVG